MAERTASGVSVVERLIQPGPNVLARRSLVVAERHTQRDSRVRRMLGFADAASLALGLTLIAFAAGHEHPVRLLAWGVATIPVWIVIFKSYGLYDRDVRRINHATIDDLPWIFHALLLGCVLMWLYYRVLPINGVGFNELAGFSIITGVAMLGLRTSARRAVSKRMGGERLLLIGEGKEIELLGGKLKAHPEIAATAVGVMALSDRAARQTHLPRLGDLDSTELPQLLRAHEIERVVVSHGDVEDDELLNVIRDCRECGVKVSVLPRLFDALGSSVEVDDVEGVTLLGMHPPVLSRSSRLLKRTMDILGALVLLVVTAPVLLAVAIAIKLDDGGPILFRQRRIGRWDSRFEVLKFRTMCPDAEAQRAELLSKSVDPGWLLLEHDPRVTRIGRFLRLTSLDELPQAWNVFRGDMSLVGPRPLVEDEGEHLVGWRRSRIDLKPGLTGLWQVLGRTSIPFDEMIKLDYLYVTNWSLWNDVRLLLRTLPIVFERRGAN